MCIHQVADAAAWTVFSQLLLLIKSMLIGCYRKRLGLDASSLINREKIAREMPKHKAV